MQRSIFILQASILDNCPDHNVIFGYQVSGLLVRDSISTKIDEHTNSDKMVERHVIIVDDKPRWILVLESSKNSSVTPSLNTATANLLQSRNTRHSDDHVLLKTLGADFFVRVLQNVHLLRI